jgi:hypothetical protein
MGSRQRRRAKPARDDSIKAVPTRTVAFVSAEERAARGLESLRPKPSPIKGSSEFSRLRALLEKSEPKSASAKKARFDALFEAYSNPDLASRLTSRYFLLTKRLNEARGAKGEEAQKRVSLEVRKMEADIALYKKLFAALKRYAPTAKDNLKVRNMGRNLWRRHDKLLGYMPSETALLAKLHGMGLGKQQLTPVYNYIRESQKSSSPGCTIELGAGPDVEKNARAIASALKQYPQLMLTRERVRAVSRFSKGEMAWRIELGAPAKFKSRKQEPIFPVLGALEETAPKDSAAPAPKAAAPKPEASTKENGRTRKKKPSRRRKEPEVVVLKPDRKPTGQSGGLSLDSSEPAAQEEERREEPTEKEEKNSSLKLSNDPLDDLELDAEVQPDAGVGDAGAGDFLGFDASDTTPKPAKKKRRRGKKAKGRRRR